MTVERSDLIHSMFDVGRSMFDVQIIPLLSPCPVSPAPITLWCPSARVYGKK